MGPIKRSHMIGGPCPSFCPYLNCPQRGDLKVTCCILQSIVKEKVLMMTVDIAKAEDLCRVSTVETSSQVRSFA